MLDWKRIIGIILVVVGLFLVSNTAFAQTPPAVVDDDALMSFLNSETEEDRMDDEVIRRYEALSEHGKEIVVEAWAQIVDQAPERYLNDQTEWLINVIRDADAVASIGYFIVRSICV